LHSSDETPWEEQVSRTKHCCGDVKEVNSPWSLRWRRRALGQGTKGLWNNVAAAKITKLKYLMKLITRMRLRMG
jgi:hypothetical protein